MHRIAGHHSQQPRKYRREAKDPKPILQAFGLGDRCDRMIKTFDQEMEAIRGIL